MTFQNPFAPVRREQFLLVDVGLALRAEFPRS